MMQNKISWLICLLFGFNLQAQEFTYEASVTPVSEQGFYSIVLSPELLGKLKSDHSDLRIYDDDGQEQPYLLKVEPAVSSTSLFKEYEVIDKVYKKDAVSHLIFSNPDKLAINNVSFLVKNTDVQKRARLSGSDDKENWYVIKNNYLLHSMKSSDETTELKMLNFPLSDYAFFKLEIDDNWKLPINILKVGYYDTQKIKGLISTFECPITEQKDSLKTSYLKLELPELMFAKKLRFEVSGADYYSRYTTVMVRKERVNKKKKTKAYFETIASFDLNSNSNNEVNLGKISTKELYVNIENRDNRPLRVDRVEASYLNRYLVVNLKPQVDYVLKFGDLKLKQPDYDIVNFSNQIPEDTPRLKHDQIISLQPELIETKEKGLLDSAYLIWFVIGAVGVVLAFVSVKMVKEIGK
ncbi:MAG: hypothetical protein ABJF04_05140 [Reichenbachiella sp.]|uniref:hypothetical protein n=2 Tax=Reichenbachiella sp. TaxID=2184521 RepID=UPI003264C05B